MYGLLYVPLSSVTANMRCRAGDEAIEGAALEGLCRGIRREPGDVAVRCGQSNLQEYFYYGSTVRYGSQIERPKPSSPG